MNNHTHYIGQVLSIIFTVFTLVRSTAHKELIDLVMAVKECGTISNLECVSKTKIRGVIALLKLATIIETHGGSNEKVSCEIKILIYHVLKIASLISNHVKYVNAVLLIYLIQRDSPLSTTHYTSILSCSYFYRNIIKFNP